MPNSTNHQLMANALRGLAIDGVEAAKSGHPGAPMGLADVATVLWTKHLKFDAADPKWPDRDRFILSAGHASMLIYGLLHLYGVPGMTIDELKRFRQLGSLTPAIPRPPMRRPMRRRRDDDGPLGQGSRRRSASRIAERKLSDEFGRKAVNHHTYVIASDGDLMEGISQEAIALAGHLRLGKLIVLWDDNGISIDGALSISDSVDQLKRFQAAGWRTIRVDGHDEAAIDAAITKAKTSNRPTLIACKTVIGWGAPKKAGSHKVHGEPLGVEEAAAAKAALGLSDKPFTVDAKALEAWRAAGRRSAGAHKDWTEAFATLSPRKQAEFTRRMKGERPANLAKAFAKQRKGLVAAPVTVATRKASELALETAYGAVPELLSGSADLTPSNNTKAKGFESITPRSFKGRYLHTASASMRWRRR